MLSYNSFEFIPAGGSMPTLLQKPNIVIFITDQERHPQYYPEGWAAENLRNRNRLIRHGLSFENACTSATMCSPSRTTLFTGIYPQKHLVMDTLTYQEQSPQMTYSYLETSLSMNLQNMAMLLRLGGYDVVYKGKWHLTKPMNGTTWTQQDAEVISLYGFDGWDPPDAGEDTAVDHFGGGTADNDGRYTTDAVNYINSVDAKRPFALIVSLVNPHDVLGYPNGWEGQYSPDMLVGPIELPPTIAEDLSTKPRCQQEALKAINVGLGPLTDKEQQLAYVNFYANLQILVDGQLGNILDALDGRGLTESTVIFRLADHGEMGLSHSGFRQKAFVTYEEALRVPFIVSNPTMFPEPSRTSALASLVDVMPTLAALTGSAPPADWRLDGRDLTPILQDPAKSVQDELLFTFDDQRAGFANQISATRQPNHIRCIRTANWKYAYYFDPKELTHPDLAEPREYEMYNLVEDPTEVTNLANPAVKGYDSRAAELARKELAARLDEMTAESLPSGRVATV